MPLPDLYPIPFAILVERLRREISQDAIYLLPKRQWWTPVLGRDLTFHHFGMSMATPLGPASGPHTQMAQNLVLAFLGGARFMELKTVQILDELAIARPCIHAPHVGYNVEWSQELRIPQSALEYAKAWYLIHLLASAQGPQLWPAAHCVFDLSVGYDLAGIQSEKIERYLRIMRDASPLLDYLRASLPPALRAWADIDVPSNIANSVTISTFHGCPADEIEAIANHLIREHRLHTVIKLNPTLLGYERVRSLLHDQLGYTHISLPSESFAKDLQWSQLLEMLPRLLALAKHHGVGFGVKLSNTLVMHSPEPPFSQHEMYLSGPPLHVLALTLAKEIRDVTPDDLAITFSAGVDAQNFPALIAASLGPVTTCTDLLKARGYGRLSRYLQNLEQDMQRLDACDLDAYRHAHAKTTDDDAAAAAACAPQRERTPSPPLRPSSTDDASRAARAFLSHLAKHAPMSIAYHHEQNRTPPKKVDSTLDLFDCLSCDKCIPVCPNSANFAYALPQGTYPSGVLSWQGSSFQFQATDALVIEKKHQIGNIADVCNLCGHCETWCPEEGGPYRVKPNLFLHRQSFADHPERDGLLIDADFQSIRWRHHGQIYQYTRHDEHTGTLHCPNGGSITLHDDHPIATTGQGEVALDLAISLRLLLSSLTKPDAETWLPSAAMYAYFFDASAYIDWPQA